MSINALQRILADARAGTSSPAGFSGCARDMSTPDTLPAQAHHSSRSGVTMDAAITRIVANALSQPADSVTAGNLDRPCSERSEVPAADAASSGPDWSPPSGSDRAVHGATELAQLKANALQDRPAKMFVAGQGGPLESGKGAAVEESTNRLVKLAAEVIEKADGILAMCAVERKQVLGYPLDDEEAYGYLLGDALDYPLDADGARAVAKRARKHLKEIKKTLPEKASSARARARKSAVGGASPDKAAEAAAARAAYLLESFDLKLHLHARRSCGRAPPRPKHKREPQPEDYHHFADGPYTPLSVALKAADAALKEVAAAEAVADAAKLALDAKLAARDKAERAIDALKPIPSLEVYAKANSIFQRKVDALEAEHDRAWAKYDAAWDVCEAACDAHNAACEVVAQKAELVERMGAWVARPNRVTPFPWPGCEYVQPCNRLDLDYYALRPDAYPPGVREWQARYESYRYDGPCTHPEGDTCDSCCPEGCYRP